MSKKLFLNGADAVAEAMRQINPDVVAAYPITPTTHIVEKFSKFVADGKVKTEFVTVESEHSAMSACIGASASGGRVMTATASQGLIYMAEALFCASGFRLPIVLINGNRALSSPLSIHTDHSDSMAIRDSGFVQVYAKNAQEAYDLTIQAIRIAEHKDVRTPVMVCIEGFQNTHTLDSVVVEDDEVVKKFLGEFEPVDSLLDIDNPVTYGAAVKPDFFFEIKRQQLEGINCAYDVMKSVGEEFGKITGRDYSKVYEEYGLEDADVAIVLMSSSYSTALGVTENMRESGKKIGLLRPKLFRPFPDTEIVEKLKGLKAVAVLDRSMPQGAKYGPLCTEIVTALFNVGKRPKVYNFIHGIGSRETYPSHYDEVFEFLLSSLDEVKEDKLRFLNLNE